MNNTQLERIANNGIVVALGAFVVTRYVIIPVAKKFKQKVEEV